MEAGSPGCRCEGCKAGPDRARPGGFQSRILLHCLAVICLSIVPRQSRQRGEVLGAPEPSFPSAWGTSQHFNVSHILN